MENDITFRNFLIISFIITGSLSYYTSKLQNIQQVTEGGVTKSFFHPYMQTLTMFIGQFGCLFVFFLFKRREPELYIQREKKAIGQGKNPNINLLLILIPASCDFLSSMLQYFAMNFIPGSIYQMLKGGSLITTALFSYLLMRNRIKRNHISGCILAFIGVMIVGASSIIFKSSSSPYAVEYQIIGYVMMVLSLTFNGFFYSYQQKLFKQYYIQPLKMVGYEGMFGICYCVVAIPILTFIRCPFVQKMCVLDHHGDSYFQRPEQFIYEFGSNIMLMIMIPLGIISVGAFNINGLTITKHINALARSLLNMTKTVFIWGIGIIVTVTLGVHHKAYQWEQLNPGCIALQVVGFSFLVFATLIYNENIKFKYLSQYEEQRQSLITSQNNQTKDSVK